MEGGGWMVERENEGCDASSSFLSVLYGGAEHPCSLRLYLRHIKKESEYFVALPSLPCLKLQQGVGALIKH